MAWVGDMNKGRLFKESWGRSVAEGFYWVHVEEPPINDYWIPGEYRDSRWYLIGLGGPCNSLVAKIGPRMNPPEEKA